MTNFIQQDTAPQLYVSLVAFDSTLPYSMAFWLPEVVETSSNTITLEETWEMGKGVYLFLKAVPDENNSNDPNKINPSILSDRLTEFFLTPAVGNTRFLWIENPQDSVFRWQFQSLSLVGDTVEKQTFINFRNYQLAIAAGVSCRLNDAKNGFVFATNPAVGNKDEFYLSTGYGSHQLKGIQVNENGEGISLPFSGDTAGCLNFSLVLHNTTPGESSFDELIYMDVALRMFFSSANPPPLDLDALSNSYSNYTLETFSGDLEQLPQRGKQLVAVAKTDNFYHARIFDGTEKQVFDGNIDSFLSNPLFVEKLDSVISGNSVDATVKQEIIATITLFLDTFADNNAFSGFAQFNTAEKFLIASHRHPFLGEDKTSASRYSLQEDGSQNISLYGTLDPLQPLNRQRSYFAFAQPGNTKTTQLSFPSCYRTNLGYTIHVTPHSHNDSRLVFAEVSGRNASVFAAPFYLTPQGKYTISVPRYSEGQIADGSNLTVQEEDNFLCGLAGIEYIQLSSKNTNILHLEPGKPAFAPDFVPGQIVDTQEAEQRLESLAAMATTPWGYIEHLAAANPIYFSQPQQSLLYRASTFQDGDLDSTNDPLRFLDVPVTGLPAGEYVPLFPYGGVTGRLANYQQMEEQLLNPQRRKFIRIVAETDNTPLTTSQLATAFPSIGVNFTTATSSTTITGTTPQGLLATYSPDYVTLHKLLLAKDTSNKDINFQDLERGSDLRTAFASNQLFLLISQPKSLKTFDTNSPPQVIKNHFQDNILTIQEWKFDLNVDNWRQGTTDGSDTILIFKFLDKPLIDILKDTALWEQPSVFVSEDGNEVNKIRDRLVGLFESAIATVDDPNAAQKDKDNARPLARIASSEFWSGAIALNVNLPANNGLPQDLKALECGINNPGNFYAQYVGSNGTPVLPKNGQLEAEQSSLFALLDYQDNSIPETGESGYAFQVASLRVQFQNSQITAFSSEVNLTLDLLFNEATQLLNSRSGRNIVILKGFTEEHNGEIIYAFSFSGENYFALPNSYILNNVDIVKATFSTDPPGSNPNLTIARFTLWGRLNFRNLDSFDAFSFGSDNSLSDSVVAASSVLNRSARALAEGFTEGVAALDKASLELQTALDNLEQNDQFLQFSKLTLRMDCEHVGDTNKITFTVDTSQIIFDLKQSKARTNSFYNKFPLKLTNFVYLDSTQPETKPKGYLPVTNPLGSDAMPDSGFGLNFELNLGSLGALAGAAQFVVNLLIVWQPNQDNSQEKAQTFVGLRLPGIGGDVLGFPLQSVLKISFKSVELIVDNSTPNSLAYLLKIKKIALKFFVLSFPPSGQTEIVIFGNPDGGNSNDSVGWYAAYAKELKALPQGNSGRASPTKR